MATAAWIFSYKLKKNVSEEQFIERTKMLHDEVISQAKIQMNTCKRLISKLVKKY